MLTWGNNNSGQLGIATTTDVSVPTAVHTSGSDAAQLSSARSVSAGRYISAAVMQDSTVRTWGGNEVMELGNPDVTGERSTTPIAAAVDGVASISLGAHHMLATRTDGSVWSWGFTNDGRVGRGGDTSSDPAPIPVSASDSTARTDLVQVFAWYNSSAAIDAEGRVWIWSANEGGQIDLSYSAISRPTYKPMPVP